MRRRTLGKRRAAEYTYDLAAPQDPSAPLTKWIEAVQISQYKTAMGGSNGTVVKHIGGYPGLIQKVEEFERSGGLRTDSGAEPVILLMYSKYSGHAVIPVSVEQTEDGDFSMQIYDPNYPTALQTLLIKKDFNGISYRHYIGASYALYSDFVDAMSDVTLYRNEEEDTTVYLSIDKENGEVTNTEGDGIDEIEGAYQQVSFAGGEEDVFSGIKSFVLPAGEYQIAADTEESGAEGTEDGQQTEDKTVTFYMAAEDYFAQITASDENAVLQVKAQAKEDEGLSLTLQSDSEEEETTKITLLSEEGVEHTIEAESGTIAVSLAGEDSLSIEVPENKAVSVDGVAAEVVDGKAEASFASVSIKNPTAEVSCGLDKKLNGTVQAEVSSYFEESKTVTVQVDFVEEGGEMAASYQEEMEFAPGAQSIELVLENLETNFTKTTGEVELTCEITITDESGKKVTAALDGIIVELKEPEEPDDPYQPSGGDDDPYQSSGGTENQTESPQVTDLTIPKSLTLGVGENYRLKARIKPAAASGSELAYKVSGKSVQVNKKGIAKAKKTGKAKVTVTAGKVSRTITVTVKNAPKKLTLNAKNRKMKKNTIFQIRTKLPKNTACSKFTYHSNKKSVASVSSTGKVTAKKRGTAVITVKTYNKKKAKLVIRVS